MRSVGSGTSLVSASAANLDPSSLCSATWLLWIASRIYAAISEYCLSRSRAECEVLIRRMAAIATAESVLITVGVR